MSPPPNPNTLSPLQGLDDLPQSFAALQPPSSSHLDSLPPSIAALQTLYPQSFAALQALSSSHSPPSAPPAPANPTEGTCGICGFLISRCIQQSSDRSCDSGRVNIGLRWTGRMWCSRSHDTLNDWDIEDRDVMHSFRFPWRCTGPGCLNGSVTILPAMALRLLDEEAMPLIIASRDVLALTGPTHLSPRLQAASEPINYCIRQAERLPSRQSDGSPLPAHTSEAVGAP
ncbi:hypothetical protein FB45DRAFT_935252 [Roridomyces roridus]|uniref:Uncharacterized protein n=1 Tax=Roridomyces roridus TaxID=1738132 RepID=A0AAD7BB91_9AGAR|nr:hypothetical protein FB45DRAFT_935252 [Roridomyces roridus]